MEDCGAQNNVRWWRSLSASDARLLKKQRLMNWPVKFRAPEDLGGHDKAAENLCLCLHCWGRTGVDDLCVSYRVSKFYCVRTSGNDYKQHLARHVRNGCCYAGRHKL
jgi:hypothetical protein